MKVGELCRRDAITIDQGMTLHQAAQRMREEHVGALVVTASGSGGVVVVGVVTDRDLAIEVLARGRDGASVAIGALASGRLAAVPFDATLSEAIAATEAEGVRRLLVTGKEKQLIGVVSIDDLIGALARDMARLARSLDTGRAREARSGLPGPLLVDGQPPIVPDEALIVSWPPAA
jgi:CBS domain-containing protein